MLLIDVASGGALVETEHRLLPGRRVELQLRSGAGTSTVSGRILRCHVARLTAEGVMYRGAIGFDRPAAAWPRPVGGRDDSTTGQAVGP